MKALLNCCQRSSAVQPHARLPSAGSATDAPPAQLQKDAKAGAALAVLSMPLEQKQLQQQQQQRDDLQQQRLPSKAESCAAGGEAAGGVADSGEKNKTGAVAVHPGEVSSHPVSPALGRELSRHSSLGHATYPYLPVFPTTPPPPPVAHLTSDLKSLPHETVAVPASEDTGAGGDALVEEKTGEKPAAEGRQEEAAATGETTKKEHLAVEVGGAAAAAAGEAASPARGGVVGDAAEDASKKKGEETAGREAEGSRQPELGPKEGEEKTGSRSSAAAEAVNGGGSNDNSAAKEDELGRAGESGGAEGARPVRHSLEEILDKKWQQLQHYLEEEQLFKAYQYLLLLEQQVEHRLAFLLQAAHGFSRSNTSSAEGFQGPAAEAAAAAAKGERGTSRRPSFQQQTETAAPASSAAASSLRGAAAGGGGGAGGGGAAAAGEREGVDGNVAEQQRLVLQKTVLCDFQKRLVSEQPLKNLRMQMAIFHQMLLEFHLDHLLQACEESRLSCCESLVSTADESEQLQQQQSQDTTHHADGVRDGPGNHSRAESREGGHIAASGKGASGGIVETGSLLQQRGSGGSSARSQSRAGSAAATGARHREDDGCSSRVATTLKDGSVLPDSLGTSSAAAAAGGTADQQHDEQQAAVGQPTPLLVEKKVSSSKTFRQGLRSVVGRKMSFGKRSGTNSKRSAVKKIVTARKKQDDEGWLRERGQCLDLAYRVEKDTSVSMKVRGKLPCMLFQVLAILNETDLAGTWAPFFKSAEKEYQYTKASQLVRQVYDYPLLGNKETLMFCVGVNALEEGGCVCIFCRSPPENAVEFMGLPIPPPGGSSSDSSSKAGGGGARGSWVGGPGGSKIPRIQSADLVFLLFPISEGRQTTLELFGNFHHGLRFVPMRIITFVVKKIVRSMFVSIARQCQNFNAGPYKERVENDAAFYGWMQQKIEEYVQQKRKASGKHPLLVGTDSAGSLASFNYEEFQD